MIHPLLLDALLALDPLGHDVPRLRSRISLAHDLQVTVALAVRDGSGVAVLDALAGSVGGRLGGLLAAAEHAAAEGGEDVEVESCLVACFFLVVLV